MRVRGLRVAGYSDPVERRARDRFRQLREPGPTPEELRRIPPRRLLARLTGHTHTQSFHSSTNVVELNGGTVGGVAQATSRRASRTGWPC